LLGRSGNCCWGGLETVAGEVWKLLLGRSGNCCWGGLEIVAGEVWKLLLGRSGNCCWGGLETVADPLSLLQARWVWQLLRPGLAWDCLVLGNRFRPSLLNCQFETCHGISLAFLPSAPQHKFSFGNFEISTPTETTVLKQCSQLS